MKIKTGNRQKNLQQNRGLILSAAKTTIELEGAHKLTIRGLANDAGLDTRTIYNLFGSKEKVISELLKEEAKIFAPVILDGLTKTELLHFHTMVDEVYKLIKDSEPLFRALIATAVGQGPATSIRQLQPLMEPMFERYVANGLLSAEADARVLSHVHMFDVMAKTTLWARSEISLEMLVCLLKYEFALLLYQSATENGQLHLNPTLQQLEIDIGKNV